MLLADAQAGLAAPRELPRQVGPKDQAAPRLSGAQEGPKRRCPLPQVPDSSNRCHKSLRSGCIPRGRSSLVFSRLLNVSNVRREPVPVVPGTRAVSRPGQAMPAAAAV